MSPMSGTGHVIDVSSTPTPTKHNLVLNDQAACLTWVPKKTAAHRTCRYLSIGSLVASVGTDRNPNPTLTAETADAVAAVIEEAATTVSREAAA
jgi:hypothetical protein